MLLRGGIAARSFDVDFDVQQLTWEKVLMPGAPPAESLEPRHLFQCTLVSFVACSGVRFEANSKKRKEEISPKNISRREDPWYLLLLVDSKYLTIWFENS